VRLWPARQAAAGSHEGSEIGPKRPGQSSFNARRAPAQTEMLLHPANARFEFADQNAMAETTERYSTTARRSPTICSPSCLRVALCSASFSAASSARIRRYVGAQRVISLFNSLSCRPTWRQRSPPRSVDREQFEHEVFRFAAHEGTLPETVASRHRPETNAVRAQSAPSPPLSRMNAITASTPSPVFMLAMTKGRVLRISVRVARHDLERRADGKSRRQPQEQRATPAAPPASASARP